MTDRSENNKTNIEMHLNEKLDLILNELGYFKNETCSKNIKSEMKTVELWR